MWPLLGVTPHEIPACGGKPAGLASKCLGDLLVQTSRFALIQFDKPLIVRNLPDFQKAIGSKRTAWRCADVFEDLSNPFAGLIHKAKEIDRSPAIPLAKSLVAGLVEGRCNTGVLRVDRFFLHAAPVKRSQPD